LRAYESLGAITRAEEVIKTEVVLPRMSKVWTIFFSSALASFLNLYLN
jgi:hypothetical protein